MKTDAQKIAYDKWYAAHKEQRKAYHKKRYNANKDREYERCRVWRSANAEQIKIARTLWYASHKEVAKESTKTWRANNIKYARQRATAYCLRRKEEIAGSKKPVKCPICKQTDKICFDHDHVTGKFRGWLCHGCNSTLGFAGDSPKILRALALYLERPKSSIRIVRQWRANEKKRKFGAIPVNCEVCQSAKRVCLDHDHKTSLFRGWLCHKCNVVLGRTKDSPKVLRKLADYLEAHERVKVA